MEPHRLLKCDKLSYFQELIISLTFLLCFVSSYREYYNVEDLVWPRQLLDNMLLMHCFFSDVWIIHAMQTWVLMFPGGEWYNMYHLRHQQVSILFTLLTSALGERVNSRDLFSVAATQSALLLKKSFIPGIRDVAVLWIVQLMQSTCRLFCNKYEP